MSNQTEKTSKWNKFLHGLRVILDIYAILIVVLIIVTSVVDLPWFLMVIRDLTGLLLLPSIPLVILFLILKKWRSVVIWLFPLLASLFLYGGMVLRFPPDTEMVYSGYTSLRVMTYNMYGPYAADHSPQIQMMRESGADIIALQEVDDSAVEAIEAGLSDLYPYQLLYPQHIAGTGIISKYPIYDEGFFSLNPGLLYHSKATVLVDDRAILIINAHPPAPVNSYQFDARESETQALVDMATRVLPVILMGDFNQSDQSTHYRIVTNSGLKDSFREVGWGLGSTWPVRHRNKVWYIPSLRIDYIFYSDELTPVWSSVGDAVESDHRPVITDFIFETGSNHLAL